MYKNLLIATDGSELAQKAVGPGLALAKSLGAAVTFVVVTPQWSSTAMAEEAERGVTHPVEEYERNAARWAGKVLADCEAEALRAGVACSTVHARDMAPAEGIIETAKSRGCDLVVMASHGRSGLGRLLLGSVATKVLTYSTIPVLIYR